MLIPILSGLATAALLLATSGGKKRASEGADQLGAVPVEVEPDLPGVEDIAAQNPDVPIVVDSTGPVPVPVDDDDIDIPSEVVPGPVVDDEDNEPALEEVLPVIEPDLPGVEDVASESPDVPIVVDESGPVAVDESEEDEDAEEVPIEVTDGPRESSLALARALLAAEKLSDWKKHHKGNVKIWQAENGLEDDGLYGPTTALALAEEVGVAPIVRYWPAGSWPGSPVMVDYIEALEAAGIAHREKGQGFGNNKITEYATL